VFAGPDLIKPTSVAVMLPTPDRTGVVIIGGGPNTFKDLYELLNVHQVLATGVLWSKE
jgi:hypothetical protein